MASLKKIIKSAPRMRNSVPNGPLVKKKGPFKGSTLKKGAVVKAEDGVTKSRTVYRNNDNTYKTVVKSKSIPGKMEKKTVKELRTFKGLIKGVPKKSGFLNRKSTPEILPVPKSFEEVRPNIVKNGGKIKNKIKKK